MILVTGATGFIGSHLVNALMDDGWQVRCLVQGHRLRGVAWAHNPEVMIGHVLDEEALFRAATGVHTIVHLENAQWWGRQRDLERIELAGTRNLVSAARAARVGRIITVSQLGASVSSAYTLMKIKGQVEEIIRGSGLAYTIVRSGIVFGEGDSFINHIAMMLRATPLLYLMPGRGEVVLHPIYIHDLVEALVRCMELPDTVDTVMEIGGPEYITVRDLIRTVMRITGSGRLIVPVPPYLMRWLYAAYRRVFPRSLITPQWLDILATNRTAPLGNTFTYFGFQPRRLEDTLIGYLPKKTHLWPTVRHSLRRRPRGI